MTQLTNEQAKKLSKFLRELSDYIDGYVHTGRTEKLTHERIRTMIELTMKEVSIESLDKEEARRLIEKGHKLRDEDNCIWELDSSKHLTMTVPRGQTYPTSFATGLWASTKGPFSIIAPRTKYDDVERTRERTTNQY